MARSGGRGGGGGRGAGGRGRERRAEREPGGAAEAPRSFLFTCLLYVALVGLLSSVFLSDFVFDDLLGGVRVAVAKTVGASMGAVGFPIRAQGEIIRGPATTLVIVNECTGMDAAILLVAAVVAFPASWTARLAGVLLSLAVMMAVNFVRVVTLVYVGNYAPDLLEIGHLYVWPVIVIISGVSTLAFWAERVRAP